MVFKQFQQHRNIIWLLLTLVILPIVTSLVAAALQHAYGLILAISTFTTIGVVLSLGYVLWGRTKPRELTTREMRPPRFPGLVVIVGTGRKDTEPDELAHNIAIEYHLEDNPEKLLVWLLATSGPRGSIATAEEVRQRYESRCRSIELVIIDDPFSVQEAYQKVLDIYRQGEQNYDLEGEQIISDFTGGTKPMSAGMILACRDRWPMQYMFGKPGIIASEPIKVEFKP